MMKIKRYELPPIGTNAWLLYDEDRGEALLCDAPLEAWERIMPDLKELGCELKAVLITHGHWDHIGDGHHFSRTGVPIYAHESDGPMMARPSAQMNPSIQGCKADHTLKDGDSLELLGQEIAVKHVPGHSPGSVLFYFSELKWAISGDVIFRGTVGRTDFPGCSHIQLINSIRKHILTLPEETVLYPGHGGRTTVAIEKRDNPFLKDLGPLS